LFFVPRVLADTFSEVTQKANLDIQKFEDFSNQIDNSGSDSELAQIVITELPLLREHFFASSYYYQAKAASEENQELIRTLSKLSNASSGMANALSQFEDAIDRGDASNLSLINQNLMSAADQYDEAIVELNNIYGVSDYGPLLSFLFWISLLISLFLFFISRGSPHLPAEKLRNEFESALFKSSLWPFGGAAISFFWYNLTPPGGTFYFLWGLIGFGYLQFLRGLYAYLRYARPAINMAKKSQQERLDFLLKSEGFQEESLREKAQQIENLKPVIELNKEK